MAEDNIIDFMERSMGQSARQGVALAAGANPDEAARALQLSDASGVPAPVIAGDLKTFDNAFRTRSAQQIVDDNAFLKTYINANPLNAQLSNDDYGNLANVGDKLTSLSSRLVNAYVEGQGEGPIGTWLERSAPEFSNKYPISAFLYKALGAPIEVPARVIGGLTYAAGQAASEVAGGLGAGEAQQNRLMRDIIGMAQVGMSGQSGLAGPGGAMRFNRAIEPYVKGNKVPPSGLDPAVDGMKAEQAKADIQALNELFDAAQASATKERAPEHFANAIREQNSGEIGISVDAIDALYGGKPILPDDGILGWVPGLAEKVEAARATGGDVQVPVADWIAKADPAVAKALEPTIRVRPDGVTLLEAAEEPKSFAQTYELTPLQDSVDEAAISIREAAKLGPTMEEAPPESGATAKLPGWLPKAQHDKILELIAKRQQADIEASQKRAERRIRQRETAAWKAKELETREAVAQEIADTPMFMADTYLREGMIGSKEAPKMRLGERFLNEEQREALPASYVTKTGEDPTIVASLFGYDNPDVMIADLAQLHRARTESKKNALAFNRALVDAEVTRRMDEFAAGEEGKILEEAKTQALAENELELLHQEVLGAAIKAGIVPEGTPPIATRAAFREIIDRSFNSMLAKDVSSDAFLRDSGQAGRRITLSAADGKWDELYRQEERRYFAANLADQAVKFEKEVEKFNRLITKYQKNEFIPTREASHQNFIHQLLAQAGYKLKISPDQITRAEEFLGKHSLDDFVRDAASFGEDLAIEPGYKPKPKEQMTVAEFRGFMDAIETLDYVGRESQKIISAGEKMDKAEAFRIVEEHIKQRPMLPEDRVRNGSKLWGLEAGITRPEEIIKDLDLREQMGPLFKMLIVPFEAGKVDEYAHTSRLSADLKKIKGFGKEWRQSLEKPVEQDFMWDPRNQTPYELDRWGMVKMMLNWGNRSNAQKLVEGIAKAGLKEGEKASAQDIALTKAKIEQLFAKNATKQDWDFAQHIWDIFDGWVPQIDRLSRNLTGKGPKFIEAQPVLTPHGEYRGGYMPLIPDKLRPLAGHVMQEREPPKGTGPLASDYFRATTNQSHLIERTGSKYFVDIASGPEQLIGRMQQVIHDLSFREYVVNAGKILYDQKMKRLISDHYGPEYHDALIGWVERIANRANADEMGLEQWNDVARKFSTRLIYYALPANPNVILSPSVGTANPANFLRFYANREANMKMVLERSAEVRNVLYSLDRDMTVALNDLSGKENWSAYQRKAAEFLMRPLTWIEQQTRAVTFYNEYLQQKAKGLTDYEAGIMADSAVRERHTVAHIGDLSAMRASKNPFLRLGTLFMGYFESQRNWLRQVPESARQGDWENVGRALWGTVGVAWAFNTLLFTKWQKNDDWFTHISKSLAAVPLQMVPYVRGAYDYLAEGRRPTEPLADFLASIADVGKDGWNWLHKGQKPKHAAKHVTQVAGTLSGFPGGVQVTRAIGLAEDVQSGQQRPRNLWEWTRGVLWGQSQQKGK